MEASNYSIAKFNRDYKLVITTKPEADAKDKLETPITQPSKAVRE